MAELKPVQSSSQLAISDQWTVTKSKLAFMSAMAEAEVYALARGEEIHTHNSAWGRKYILEEIYDEMNAVIHSALALLGHGTEKVRP